MLVSSGILTASAREVFIARLLAAAAAALFASGYALIMCAGLRPTDHALVTALRSIAVGAVIAAALITAGRLLRTVRRGALKVWLSPLCSNALIVADRSIAPSTFVNTCWIPTPTAGFTDPEGEIAFGKFWLFANPVKSWGSVLKLLLPPLEVCHNTPNCMKAGLEIVTKRASIKTCWIGWSNSLMIFSITSSCSGVPVATTRLRS